jgi:hypothetical protein
MDSLLDASFVILADRSLTSTTNGARQRGRIKRRGTLAHDPWSEPHLHVETVDPWTIRLDGRARLAEARLGTADVSSAVAPS